MYVRFRNLCLFISKKLSFVKRSDISFFNSEIESTFIEINNLPADMKNCIVGVVYRPPKSSVTSFNDYINVIMNKISFENKDGFIMGDFNIDLLKGGLMIL